MPFCLDFHLHSQKWIQKANEYVRKFQESLSTTLSQKFITLAFSTSQRKNKKWFVFSSYSYMKFLCQICTLSTSRVLMVQSKHTHEKSNKIAKSLQKKKKTIGEKPQMSGRSILCQISFKLITEFWCLVIAFLARVNIQLEEQTFKREYVEG